MCASYCIYFIFRCLVGKVPHLCILTLLCIDLALEMKAYRLSPRRDLRMHCFVSSKLMVWKILSGGVFCYNDFYDETKEGIGRIEIWIREYSAWCHAKDSYLLPNF
jgi:hypothetical protein